MQIQEAVQRRQHFNIEDFKRWQTRSSGANEYNTAETIRCPQTHLLCRRFFIPPESIQIITERLQEHKMPVRGEVINNVRILYDHYNKSPYPQYDAFSKSPSFHLPTGLNMQIESLLQPAKSQILAIQCGTAQGSTPALPQQYARFRVVIPSCTAVHSHLVKICQSFVFQRLSTRRYVSSWQLY